MKKEKIQNRGIGGAPVVLLVLSHVNADLPTWPRCEHVDLLKLRLSVSTLQLSRDCPPRYHASPNRDKSKNHTGCHIEKPQSDLAILDRPQRLILKAGKGRVASDEANWDQVSPVRAPVSSRGQQGKDQANQKRAGNINDERSVGKASPHFAADVAAQPKAQNRPQTASNANQYIFQQDAVPFSFICSYRCRNRSHSRASCHLTEVSELRPTKSQPARQVPTHGVDWRLRLHHPS